MTADYTDDAGNVDSETIDDDGNYFGAVASYTTEKQVSTDGGMTWKDADTVTGDELLEVGADPQFRVIATNTGNVAVSVDVSDSDFTSLSVTDFNLAVGATNVVVVEATEAWAEGQHTNTATVTADYTDDAGNVDSETIDDDGNYFGAVASYTTEKQVSIIPSPIPSPIALALEVNSKQSTLSPIS